MYSIEHVSGTGQKETAGRRSTRGHVRAATVLAAALLVGPLAGGGAALAQGGEAVQAQRDALFQQMMANPADVEVALEYVALSEQAGDLEGAVSTLERLSIFAPDSARISFELGRLYFALGAHPVAAGHFETAAASDGFPPPLAAQIPLYLTSIEREMQPNRLRGLMSAGVRYQSNANAGAENSTVLIYGLPFELGDGAMAQADGNAFLSGVVEYSHDLASQGDRLEARLAGYGAYYHDLDTLNAVRGQARFGPVFNLERFSIEDTELSIEALAGAVVLSGEVYRDSLGLGIGLESEFGPATTGSVQLDLVHQRYHNTPSRPSVAGRTGFDGRLTARVEHQITDMFTAYAELHAGRHSARNERESYWRGGAMTGARFAFDGPGDAARPWSLDVSSGLSRSVHDAADAMLSPDPRRDWQFGATVRLDVPVADGWSVNTSLAFQRVVSSQELNSRRNVSGSLGVSKAF